AAGVRVGYVAEHVELLGRDLPVGDLHPEHLVVAALTLAVHTVVQPEDPEHVLVELTGQVLRQHPLELLDVRQLRRIDLELHHGLQPYSKPEYSDQVSSIWGPDAFPLQEPHDVGPGRA